MEVKDVFGDLPALTTQRLWLRKVEPGDLSDIYEYASDPKVAQYTTWYAHASIEDSKAFIDHMLDLYSRGQVANWGVVHKADAKFIGTCGFIDWHLQHARAEIGYALSCAYWGRGLMTEAVREVIAFGFRTMKLNRIQGRCEVANIASARVMEKVGMRLEGVLREAVESKGEFVDIGLYSILRREWGG